MKFVKGLEQNLIFLILEVIKQVENTQEVLEKPYNEKLIEKIQTRDDYIDNMKSLIENKSNKYFLKLEKKDKEIVDYIRAIVNISSNLEHLADHAVNIVSQTKYLTDQKFIKRYNYKQFFKLITDSISLIEPALNKKNVEQALKICRAEFTLDELYKENIQKIIEELRSGENTENLITTLFIFQYLERIGDSILNIGESIISVVIGEKIKIHQYQELEKSLSESRIINKPADIVFESVAETKSGCLVRRVYESNNKEDSQWVIFKEGNLKKIESEKEKIELWEKIDPGTSPKIFGFNKERKNGSLVLEYLQGKNFKEIIINERFNYLKNAFSYLTEKLDNVWTKTKTDYPVEGKYLDQLYSRIKDVYKVHPQFKTEKSLIGDIEIPAFEDMILQANEIDKKLKSPFSVLIHGDLNNDNIIYNENKNQIHFIDVHRSAYKDYVQDISVFIVSNFRMPIFAKNIRKKINWIILEIHKFAGNFAKENNDNTYELRLSLGLIRSFITSTRFELHEEFANLMHMKGIYILEKLLSYSEENWQDFRLSEDVLLF